MYLKLPGLLIAVTLFACNCVIAQTIIKGTVTDTAGVPLPGITVRVKGTKTLAASDANGKFSIAAPPSATLTFSYIGYNTQEVVIGQQTNISVILREGDKSLNEVVVIGYGTKKKTDLTGTVNSLEGSTIVEVKAPTATEAMQGQLPGVDVKATTNKPGNGYSINIRGINSINSSTQPLYVIDGAPVVNGIDDINPADIERIDVLKDASSTAIYGSRGANGVVLVTTKKGTKGPARITYDAYAGFVNAYNLPPMMTGPEFVSYARDFYNELAQATALLSNQPAPTSPVPDSKIFSATELANIAAGTYTNWVNVVRQNGRQTNNNITVTGGDDKTQYFASMGYQYYGGTTKNEYTERYTLKVGLDKSLSIFKFGASMNSTYGNINPGSNEAFRSSYRLRPTGSSYNSDGTPRFYTYEGESQITNPMFDLANEVNLTQYIRAIPTVYGLVNIIKGLSFKSSFTADINFQRAGSYDGQFTKTNDGTKPASGSNLHQDWFTYTLDNVLTYNNEIGKSKFDVTLGSSSDYYQYDNSNISVTGLPYQSLWYNVGSTVPVTINGVTINPTTTVSSAYTKQTIQSYFARVNYTFNNKYLITGTLRGDGNSIFAPGHQWGYFPSAAFAWKVTEEDFMKDVSWISNMKLRLSTGRVGNAAVSNVLYPYVTQSTIGATQYNFGATNANGFSPSLLANKDLNWEKTTEYDAGLDIDIFKGRISAQIDYYNKTAHGLLSSEALPPEDGFGSVTANLGTVRNSGIEVSLTSTNIRSKNFSWTTNLNYSHNHNVLLNIYGPGNNTNNVAQSQFIGYPLGLVYGYKIIGVWQQSQAAQAATYGQIPGQYRVQDITTSGLNTGTPTAANLNPDGVINSNDRQVLGSSIPSWFGGITNSFKYKDFDFSVVVYTRQGTFEQSVFLTQELDGDQGRARFNAFSRSYWTPTNPSNTWANQARETDGSTRTISEYQNSSYTKISNMVLGYTLTPQAVSKIGIKRLRIYVDANNPFIFTKFIGWDPENPNANSFGNADFRTRTFMLGVNVSL
jgi:TonB-linked SusC/RagA family outer membrane protein